MILTEVDTKVLRNVVILRRIFLEVLEAFMYIVLTDILKFSFNVSHKTAP